MEARRRGGLDGSNSRRRLARTRRRGPECERVSGLPPDLVVKRKLVRRFPYVVIFVEFDRTVRVIAVAHGARKPGYWRDRI